MSDQLTPDEKKGFEQAKQYFAESYITKELYEGKEEHEIVKGLVQQGWPAESTRDLIEKTKQKIENYRNSPEGRQAMGKVKKEENFLSGIIGGIVAAIIGAILWGLISAWTEFQIGWMAVGVGALVGFAVRFFGKGVSVKFGIIGAILALLGCLAGNVLAVCIYTSKEYNMPIFEVISVLDFETIGDILGETFSWIDILFYAIALYEGFRFSFRRI